MQIAEVGGGLHDALAVELQYYAEHPVRGRMLRSHVQQEFFLAPDRRGVLRKALSLFQERTLLVFGNLPRGRRGRLIEPREKGKRAAPAPALRGEVFTQGIA